MKSQEVSASSLAYLCTGLEMITNVEEEFSLLDFHYRRKINVNLCQNDHITMPYIAIYFCLRGKDGFMCYKKVI